MGKLRIVGWLSLGLLLIVGGFQNCARPGDVPVSAVHDRGVMDESPMSELEFDDLADIEAEPDVVAGATAKLAQDAAPAGAPKKNFLRTSGNQIIDAVTGKPVGLSGVSWKGFQTTRFAPAGLYARNWQGMLGDLKKNGFNVLRIPLSLEMFKAGKVPNDINFFHNPDLEHKTPVQILDMIIAKCGQLGIRVVLDMHRVTAGLGTEDSGLWYDAKNPESAMIARWEWLATRYKGNPTVIGADVFNEPHDPAVWGGGGKNDFARYAEAAGNAIHAVNKDWLIIVEGISGWKNVPGIPWSGPWGWWGQNLQGVAKRPIKLKVANKVVYSPHVYPPDVLGQSPKELFTSAKFPGNMAPAWNATFGYIYTQKIAPIWIGEFAFNEAGQAANAKCKFKDPKEKLWISAWMKYLSGDFNLDGKKEVAAGAYPMSWAYWDWGFDDCGRYLYTDVRFSALSGPKLKLLKPLQYPAF